MMKKYSVTILILTIILSACCPMVSVNPLSPPAGLDKRLEGVWKYDSKEGEEVYLHIGEKSENTMVALSVEHKKNDKLDIIQIPFSLTKTITNNYLNVKLGDLSEEVSGGNKGYLFLKYSFADNNTLFFFQLDRQLIISAIQTNKLTGKITYKRKIVSEGKKNSDVQIDRTIDCVTITDTSKNIINFIESDKDGNLFSNTMKLTRVN